MFGERCHERSRHTDSPAVVLTRDSQEGRFVAVRGKRRFKRCEVVEQDADTIIREVLMRKARKRCEMPSPRAPCSGRKVGHLVPT